MRSRSFVLLGLLTALLLASLNPAPASAATHTRIEGSGTSAFFPLLDQWFYELGGRGITVTYGGIGSAPGRHEFDRGLTDFAVSELAPGDQGDQGDQDAATTADREAGYVPAVGSGLALTYHLSVGGDPVTDLNLSGETVAKIFTNQITRWDDPAITRDNGGRVLPAIPVVPVVRADAADESFVLTSWLTKQFPAIWSACHPGVTATRQFPDGCTSGAADQVALYGSDQVMNRIQGEEGVGSIGYVPTGYARNKRQPVAAVGNSAGQFLEPTTRAVWNALRQADTRTDGSVVLDSTLASPSPDTYPLVYVAHAVVPTSAYDPRMTTARRQTLVDVLHYSLCAGQRFAAIYGEVPLPVNLVQDGLAQLARLKDADADVDLSGAGISTCDNPTFDPATLADAPPPYPAVTVDPPTITGRARVGSSLSATIRYEPPGVTYSFEWRADGRPIVGATGGTYVPTFADLGKRLTATVTPHEKGSISVPATSDPTSAVVRGPVAIAKPRLRITSAPTRHRAGRAVVTIVPKDGGPRIDGRTDVVLRLRLGHRVVTRRTTVTFADGSARITLPRLTRPGRWRVSVRLTESDVIGTERTSKAVTVRVRT